MDAGTVGSQAGLTRLFPLLELFPDPSVLRSAVNTHYQAYTFTYLTECKGFILLQALRTVICDVEAQRAH